MVVSFRPRMDRKDILAQSRQGAKTEKTLCAFALHRNQSESRNLAKILPRMARMARMEVVRSESVSDP
jgi:hypothetical protein